MLIPIEDAIEIGTKVLKRAESDPEFRELALKDGTAAVELATGSKLPDGLKVRFVETPRGTITIGLPPAETAAELSDAELEQVAGGRLDNDTAAGIVDGAINAAASLFRR